MPPIPGDVTGTWEGGDDVCTHAVIPGPVTEKYGICRCGAVKTDAHASPLTPFWQTRDGKTVRLYQGDVISVLQRMPACSVQCVVTSPPYYGLRDYCTATWEGGDAACGHVKRDMVAAGMDGSTANSQRQGRTPPANILYGQTCGKCGARRIDQQIGLEKTPELYVAKMVAVFREVRRVLRGDGTLWLNLGDSYTAGGGSRNGLSASGLKRNVRDEDERQRCLTENKVYRAESVAGVSTGVKHKDLLGIPWLVAFALRADGWYLRQDIIWHKPNPMPESVTDRCTKAHEYLFLLTKSARYHCDMGAIKEESAFAGRVVSERERGMVEDLSHKHAKEFGHTGTLGAQYGSRSTDRNKRSVWTADDESSLLAWMEANHPEALAEYVDQAANVQDVLRVATQPFLGAHFAVMPQALVEPCIKAGTSENGCCPACRAPWQRVVERTSSTPGQRAGYTRDCSGRNDGARAGHWVDGQICTKSWEPSCTCNAGEPVPCLVLDPFIGSGTTALVAMNHGVQCWGVDLSEKYLRTLTVPRIQAELGLRPATRWLAGYPQVKPKRMPGVEHEG